PAARGRPRPPHDRPRPRGRPPLLRAARLPPQPCGVQARPVSAGGSPPSADEIPGSRPKTAGPAYSDGEHTRHGDEDVATGALRAARGGEADAVRRSDDADLRVPLRERARVRALRADQRPRRGPGLPRLRRPLAPPYQRTAPQPARLGRREAAG